MPRGPNRFQTETLPGVSNLLPAGNRLDYVPRWFWSVELIFRALLLDAPDIVILLAGHFRPQGASQRWVYCNRASSSP